MSNYLRQYYSNIRPTASAADIEAFVQRNTGEYAKGGRVGYALGDRVNKDQIKEDLGTALDLSLPGAILKGIGSIKDRVMESDIETKDIMKMNQLQVLSLWLLQ